MVTWICYTGFPKKTVYFQEYLVGASRSETLLLYELTKIVLQSSTKFYGVKLNQLVKGTEPKTFSLFLPRNMNTERD